MFNFSQDGEENEAGEGASETVSIASPTVFKFCQFFQKQLLTHLLEIKEATVVFSRIKIKMCYHPKAVSLLIMVSYTSVVKGTIMRFLTTHICPQCQVTCSCSLSLAKTER